MEARSALLPRHHQRLPATSAVQQHGGFSNGINWWHRSCRELPGQLINAWQCHALQLAGHGRVQEDAQCHAFSSARVTPMEVLNVTGSSGRMSNVVEGLVP